MTAASGADRDRYWLCDDGCTTDCGVCKGAGPPPPSYRDQLDQLVLRHWRTPTSGCVCGGLRLGQSYSRHLADVLLPVVERAKAEGGAEALETAAEELDTRAVELWHAYKSGPITDARRANPHTEGESDGWENAGTHVRDRAAALRGSTGGAR